MTDQSWRDIARILIKRWEGCKLKAYKCPADKWTIGYGETKGIREGMVWTQQQAEDNLEERITGWGKVFDACLPMKCYAPRIKGVMVSFLHNLGETNFRNSTMLRRLRDGRTNEAADQLLRWVYAGGKKSQGLVNRRTHERSVFLGGKL